MKPPNNKLGRGCGPLSWLTVGIPLLLGVVTLAVATTWFTFAFFFRGPSSIAARDLVGEWRQEQPLGDAAGSAGQRWWTFTFSADGRFKVHAAQITRDTWQPQTIDSSGRWTFSGGKLVMTFDSDGKSETVLVSRLNSTTLAVDKGSKRNFLKRLD
jgi:hypothetical protein